MEPRFGHDFSKVRVHADAEAAASARAVNALAYTVGNHVVFAAGRYGPGTVEGHSLLAHELTHVLQQPADGIPSHLTLSDSSEHEREADRSANAMRLGWTLAPVKLLQPLSVAMQESDAEQAPHVEHDFELPPRVVRMEAPAVREMEQRPRTESELRDEARLRRLASRPGEALKRWKRLNDAQRSFVTMVMTGLYGAEFTLEFLQYANGKKKPDISTKFSNSPSDQPAELTKRGYKHAVDNVWVHPSGHEVQAFPPSQRAGSQPLPQPPPDTDDVKRNKCEATCNDTNSEDECEQCCDQKIPASDPICRRQCKVKCPVM
jgi:hypothetical protein